jgi:Mrp family chromosome partitioning ATPase
MQRGLPERRRIKDVKKVIAVSSAKGGVGKSTIAGMIDQDEMKSSMLRLMEIKSTSLWHLLVEVSAVASSTPTSSAPPSLPS